MKKLQCNRGDNIETKGQKKPDNMIMECPVKDLYEVFLKRAGEVLRTEIYPKREKEQEITDIILKKIEIGYKRSTDFQPDKEQREQYTQKEREKIPFGTLSP